MNQVQMHGGIADDYSRKILSRWLVIYVIVGLIVYAVVYFLVMSRDFTYRDYSVPQRNEVIQIQDDGNVI